MEKILCHKYEVLYAIGSGGMGQVWLARDTHLNQLVVVKESKEEFVALETAILKELEHPGLPIIYDCFCQDKSTFLVMEYIEGVTMRQYLERHGKAAGEQALKWAVELCRILSYLHDRHPAVIYRDLKPENIIIRQNGTLKLIDFGGALHCLCGDKKEIFCVGTKAYSPPEQWQNTRGDVTWDIYGLGVLLHEMLTGDNPARPAYRRCSVREYDKGLPGILDKIIARCTAAEAGKRYQSMRELEEALRSSMTRVPVRLWRGAKRIVLFFTGIYTALCFAVPLLSGVPENEFPFPYLEKPLFFLMITLLWYLLFFTHKNKKNFLCKREKNIWLSEKKFSGLISAILFVLGGVSAMMISGAFMPGVCAEEETESLWVEMRDDEGRKLLLKNDAVYTTDDRVRFELPVKRLPREKLALQIVAVGEDGKRYESRIFYVKGVELEQIN